MTTPVKTVPLRGNKYRWLVLVACWASFTLTSVDRSTWGPASVYVGEGLGIPLASLGVFATGYYIGYVISNALGGMLTDRFGGRYVLTVSLAGAGIMMWLFGSTTSAILGISIQFLVGLFAGADYSAGVQLISSWFKREEIGLPMGLFMTATSLGTAIANAVVPSLIASHGWTTSYHTFGLISIGVAALLFFFLRPGPLVPPRQAQEKGAMRTNLGSLRKNRNFILVSLAGFCGMWGLYGFITWSNALMIRGSHIDPRAAGLVVVIFATTAVFVKPVLGWLTDKLFGGRRKAAVITFLGLFVIALFLFGSSRNQTMFLVVAPLLGLAAYGWSPLMVAMIPKLVRDGVVGTAAGVSNATWQLGSVIVPVVVGAVFGATGSFLAAFATLAIGPLIGLLLMLPVRENAPVDETTAADRVPDQGESVSGGSQAAG